MSSSVPWAPSNTTRPAAVERVPDERRRVRDVRLEPVPEGPVLLGHRVQVDARVLGERPQAEPLGLERGVDLLLEDLLVEQVLHADAEPGRLVGVAGSDAAAGGADLQLAEPRLTRLVEQQVVGHDQVCVGGDAQPADVDPAPAQSLDLLGQHARVDDHAVADRAQPARVEDPRRDQVELVRLVAPDDRVPGVVAALEADDQIGLLGEQVGDLALALVAPLGANHDVSRHFASSVGRLSPAGGHAQVRAHDRDGVVADLDQPRDGARAELGP